MLVVLASLKSNTGNKTKNAAQCFFYLKEKKLICYLDPKPNAYIKKIATSCQKAKKITVPNFFIKSFPLQNHPQPSLSSLGCAVSSFLSFTFVIKFGNLTLAILPLSRNQFNFQNSTGQELTLVLTSILTIDKRRNIL